MNKVHRTEIEGIIEKLQGLVEDMDCNEIENIEAEPNTYKLYDFISISGRGFIDLDNLDKYIEEDEE